MWMILHHEYMCRITMAQNIYSRQIATTFAWQMKRATVFEQHFNGKEKSLLGIHFVLRLEFQARSFHSEKIKKTHIQRQ